MSLKVLKTRQANLAARRELALRGIDFTDPRVRQRFLDKGWLSDVGDPSKSWDLLQSIDFITNKLGREAAILDIGSYASEILCALHHLKYHHLTGIDLNPHLATMPFSDSIHYIVGNFMTAPLADASFDAITAISVIEHGFDCVALLKEISRLLKPGGYFIASIDYWEEKINTSGISAFGLDWTIFSAGELQELIRQSARYQLFPYGELDFDTNERTVDWNGKQYTFAWLVLNKADGKVPVRSQPIAPPAKPVLQSHGAECGIAPARCGELVETGKGRLNRPRIAILSTYNQRCGIATHTGFLAKALRHALHDCPDFDSKLLILAEDIGSEIGSDEPEVLRCWSRRNENFSRVKAVLKAYKVKVLHIQFQDGVFAETDLFSLMDFCRRAHVKVFLTIHSTDSSLTRAALLANEARLSFTHLEQGRVRLIAYGAAPEKVRVVPHGILELRPAVGSVTECKARLGIPAMVRVISSLGFFEPHKGILEILQVLPTLIAKHNAIFAFLGGPHPDNPQCIEYERSCRELASSLGIENRVMFAAEFLPDEQLSAYLGASDAVVLNYTINRNEASGALALALAHQRPLVTTAMPPFSPFAECTLQISDVLGLTEALDLVLSRKQFADYLADQARRCLDRHSFARLADILVKSYQESVKEVTNEANGAVQSTRRPVIGVDARTFTRSESITRGIGHYSFFHLLHTARLRPEWQFRLFMDSGNLTDGLNALLALPNVVLMEPDRYRSDAVDLMHLPDPMGIYAFTPGPFELFMHPRTTVTFHDLIPYYHYIGRWSEVSRSEYLKRLDLIRQSGCVIFSNSEFTKSTLVNQLKIAGQRIVPIMAGLNDEEYSLGEREVGATVGNKVQWLDYKSKYAIDKPYFLHVGSLDPHKNFHAVAKSFLACRAKHPVQLVVVGRINEEGQGFRNFFQSHKVNDVIFTDYVPRSLLNALYREAIALLFLSKFEGFGFPVLEAMAHGCPVITARTTAIPETAGDAAILCDPDDVAAIATWMSRLLTEQQLRQEMKSRGFRQAAKFSWERTALRTVQQWGLMLDPSTYPAIAQHRVAAKTLDLAASPVGSGMVPSEAFGATRVTDIGMDQCIAAVCRGQAG